MIVPAATGNTARQLEMMIDFGVTAVHCTPSYAFYLAETAEELDLIDKLSLKAAIFGGEPWSENTRKQLEKRLNLKAYDCYAYPKCSGQESALNVRNRMVSISGVITSL